MASKTIGIGDRVAYSVRWLRSVGETRGELPRLRGTVEQIIPFGGPGRALAGIKWDNYPPHEARDDDDTHDIAMPGLYRVLDANLTLVSRIGVDSALNT
jgi:hypothetical protein